MRPACDRCDIALPIEQPGSWICSYETTFCADCARAMDLICPECGGEMMERPPRPFMLHA